jgi:homoserine kinase
VPGSVANLGGGFDTLGVAVQLYLRARVVDVRDDGGTRLVVGRSTPSVSGHNAVERGFETMARRTGRRTPTVYVEVESDIPMAAGLGSSAAATVAGVRLFQRFAGTPLYERLSDEVLLGAAAEVEGHADNAAPALYGGLTSVMDVEGQDPVALRWAWPDELRLVVATPAVGLATAKARAALADVVSRRDAIFNLQHVLAFVHALQARDFGRLREAVRDRWHQPARAALVPLLGEVLSIEDPDVVGSFLSGAGPSVALLAHRNVERVAQVVAAVYAGAGVEATVRTLAVHQAGVGADVLAPSVGRAR